MPANPNTPAPLDLAQFDGHTPGPWTGFPCFPQGNIEIGRLESHSNLLRLVCTVDADDKADAALIAAAPALLAALTEARRELAESQASEAQLRDLAERMMQAQQLLADDRKAPAMIRETAALNVRFIRGFLTQTASEAGEVA